MSGKNPYQTPGAELERDDGAVHNPTSVGIGNGVSWFTDGFRLFTAAPLMWIVLMVVLFILVIILSIIPLVNLALYVIMPVFVGGIMMGCKQLDSGGGLEFGHLFAGFSKFGKLFGVGLVYFAGIIAAVAVPFILFSQSGVGQEFLKIFAGQEPDPNMFGSPAATQEFLLFILVYLALVIPVAMATWFAPVLVALHDDIGVLTAVKMSFVGCLKNILPMLLYGIVVMLAFIIGIIPLGLGLLAVIPAVYASIYTAYKNIYLN